MGDPREDKEVSLPFVQHCCAALDPAQNFGFSSCSKNKILALSCLWRCCRYIMSHSHIRSEEVWRSPCKKNMQLSKDEFAELRVLVNAADMSGKEYFGYKGDFFSLFPVLKV